MYRMSVTDDVRELVEEVIQKNDWEPVFNIKYYPGTELGDGYASKHVAVDVIRENGVTSKLFVKYAHDLKISGSDELDKFYKNEIYFYDVVYPTYAKFLREKNIDSGFNQVPKRYGTSTKNVIVLDNLKRLGYTLFDRTGFMNDDHLTLVFKNFAKYHALSFAFRDQQRERYEELVKGCSGVSMSNMPPDSPFIKMLYSMVEAGLAKFDPERDQRILDRCKVEEIVSIMVDVSKSVSEYSVITKGDCWCNNMMFLYEKGDKQKPIEVLQVDWQLIQTASLVYDLSYFFYTAASPEALAKTQTYLQIYYDELSSQIKSLGSDPTVLYPRSVFDDEWKRYCKYGFSLAFMIFKVMLASKEDIPQMENIVEDMKENGEMEFFSTISREDEYTRRLRVLAEFMVDNDYI